MDGLKIFLKMLQPGGRERRNAEWQLPVTGQRVEMSVHVANAMCTC